MHIFEEEERCLNETFMNLREDHPRYIEINERLTEIGELFDIRLVKLDTDALKKLQIKKAYKLEKRKIMFHQNHLNPQLAEFYIERAYKEYPKDRDYWIFKSINIILNEDWLELKKTSENLLKLNPDDISGIFFKTMYYIEVKDFG